MPFPTFVAASTLGAVQTGNVTPALPSGVQADDILFLFVMTNGANTFPTPTNYTRVATAQNSANSSCDMFWKRAGAGESAPAAFTIAGGTGLSNSNGLFCRMYAYRGCITTGTPFENAYRNSNTSANINPSRTGTGSSWFVQGAERLHVVIVGVDDDTALSSVPTEGWTQSGTHLTSTTGGDVGISGYQRDQTEDPGNSVSNTQPFVLSGAEFWHHYSWSLLPPSGSAPLPHPAQRQVHLLGR